MAAALALLFVYAGGSATSLLAATHDGRAVHVLVPDELRMGEICYQAARRGAAAIPRDFASGVMKCQPARRELTLSAGRFVVMSRVPGKYVSRPALVEFSTDGAERIEAALHAFPAATLMFALSRMKKLSPGALFGALVVRPPDGGPALGLVLSRGAAELTVPAESPILPMAVVNGVPIAIGAMQTLAMGETKSAGDITRRGRAVLAPVAVWRRAGDALPPEPPQILLERDDGFRYVPSGYGEADENIAAYDDGVVAFPDVEPGRYDLVERGGSWRKHGIPVVVSATSISVPRKSLIVAPGTRIAVRISSRTPVQQNICGVVHPEMPPRPQIQLRRCADAVTAAEHPARCRVVDERWMQDTAADFFADEGDYVLALTMGDIESHNVLRVGSDPVETTLELIPLTISGRITRAGEGVRAHVTVGASNAGSDDDGHYTVDIAPGDRVLKVAVKPCHEGFVYEKEIQAAMLSSGRLDIDVPATELSVRVRDGSTGAAVEDVVIRVERLAANSRFEQIDEVSATDGRHSFLAYERDATIRVCATAAGYASACSAAFRFGTGDEREIELLLHPVSHPVSH
jgi:hypothetical protein